MSPVLLLAFILVYFGILLFVAMRTGEGSTNDSFFIGNRSSNWMLVAFGMIGTSLSGVTFISVPGAVGTEHFGYLQVTLGYLLGYIAVAYLLLPLYYKLQLTSIYGYLKVRMGGYSYKTGAVIFIISRLVGATARLYLVVNILQTTILDSLGIPFLLTTLLILGMIILYTYKGGVKTIVWTDMLQTTCMLAGLVICTVYMLHHLGIGIGGSVSEMQAKGYTRIFGTDPNEKSFFLKQILAGAFITITMTGIDQEMMQKSISVSKLKDSQKNMVVLGVTLLGVITLFLYMGGLLHLYGAMQGVQASGDRLFPEVALHHMPPAVSIIFIIALVSALFPSADGAMTALTSSICLDLLGLRERQITPEQKETFRKRVHLGVALSFLLMVFVFKIINDNSMIQVILKLAGFTYGPLLGLFAFGIFTKYRVRDRLVPVVCVVAPLLSYLIDRYQSVIFGNFKIGLELLIINGMITFFGLWMVRQRD